MNQINRRSLCDEVRPGLCPPVSDGYDSNHAESPLIRVTSRAHHFGIAIDMESDAERSDRIQKLLSTEF
jgi:hypothetical protein